ESTTVRSRLKSRSASITIFLTGSSPKARDTSAGSTRSFANGWKATYRERMSKPRFDLSVRLPTHEQADPRYKQEQGGWLRGAHNCIRSREPDERKARS